MAAIMERTRIKTRAEEFFTGAVSLTRNVRFSREATSIYVVLGLAHEWPAGDLVELFRKWGIRKEYWERLFTLPHADADSRAAALFKLIVSEPDSVIDIPSSECIERYLPRERSPTRDEIEDAIEECRRR